MQHGCTDVGAYIHRCLGAAWMHGCMPKWTGTARIQHRCRCMGAAWIHKCSIDAAWVKHRCTGVPVHGCTGAREHSDFREAPAFEMAAQPQEVLTCMPQERLTMRQGAS